MRLLCGLVGSLVILTSSCVVAPSGRKQLILVSQEQEMQLGAQAYQEALKDAKVVKSGATVDRVKRVGARIAKVTGKDFQWEFNVIDDPATVNAFCLPGGKVVVYTGIMKLATTDDELAVVMGHEIAHATCRHGAERISQDVLVKTGLSAADVLVKTESAETNQLIQAALGMGAQVGILLPYSRKHETEADEVGLQYLHQAGFNVDAAATFWEKMAAMGGGATPQWLSTHPSNETRIENLRRLAEEIKKQPKP
jgi:metalloendopeptidase OMA1, mitochondrial